MADNYLEKKFEEHLNAPYKPAKKAPPPPKTRRVVVVGGDSGLGPSIVKSLRVAAHKVAFCGVDDMAGKSTALSTGADFSHVDVADADSLRGFIRDVAEKWGGVDAIVNNVEATEKSDVLDFAPGMFDEAMAKCVRPILIGAQAMAKLRADAVSSPTYGRIVNVIDSVGPVDDVNAAACGAIISLTSSLSARLSPWRVTVNTISAVSISHPGEDSTTDTPITPAGRPGRPDDVTRAIRFLLDDNADYVCGQNIAVDGGMERKIDAGQ